MQCGVYFLIRKDESFYSFLLGISFHLFEYTTSLVPHNLQIYTVEFEAPPNPPFAAWKSAGVIERTCRDYNTAFIVSFRYKEIQVFYYLLRTVFCREDLKKYCFLFWHVFSRTFCWGWLQFFCWNSLPKLIHSSIVVKRISFSFLTLSRFLTAYME